MVSRFWSFIKLFSLFLFFEYVNSLNCDPFAVHISLGNYYNHYYDNYNATAVNLHSSTISDDPFENQTLNILFQTQDPCPNMQVAIVNNSKFILLNSTNSMNSFSFQQKNLENATKYIYNVSLQKEYPDFGKKFNYSIYFNNSNNLTMKNFSARLPVRDLYSNVTQRFLFVGMMDNSSHSSDTFTRMHNLVLSEDNSVDLIVYLGDMAFNLQDFDYTKGDTFLNSIQSFATSIPFMTTPGIRENNNNFKYYKSIFQMLSDARHGDFYSFNVGLVHFIQINMALFFTGDSTNQTLLLGWLENDLKVAGLKENRSVRPWIFIYGYYNFYCSYDRDLLCPLTDLKVDAILFENKLKNYKVDIYFSSHYPIYQRSKPLFLNQTLNFTSKINPDPNFYYIYNPTAIVYMVEGVGGNNVTSIPGNAKSNNYLFNSTKPGYGILNVINLTHLFYQHYGSSNNEIIDEYYLINEALKWDQQWTSDQQYQFVVTSVIFVVFGIILIGAFQIYVDSVM